MNSKERKLKIKRYAQGYQLLMDALKDIPRKSWKFKPAPSEWSIH